MKETEGTPMKNIPVEERTPWRVSGMAILLLNIALMAGATVLVVLCGALSEGTGMTPALAAGLSVGLAYLCIVGPVLFAGLKVLKPNEAMVFTLFGRYYGSLAEAGYFFVNPFVSAVPSPKASELAAAEKAQGPNKGASSRAQRAARTISLKAMTLNNDKQKINDAQGNPIIIGIVVIWKVVNATKALLNVDDYFEYLSIQCDSALRNIVRLYPYDSTDDETSLRGSSQEVAQRLLEEIQQKTVIAGIEILEARITHLSYAPEIAAAMLQRQQASAIIAARQMIVEGAVGMVEMALEKLSANNIVELDEERKASMVSNLLVVLCSNKDAQPVVNSGSIY